MNVRVDVQVQSRETCCSAPQSSIEEMMPGALQGHVSPQQWQSFVSKANKALSTMNQQTEAPRKLTLAVLLLSWVVMLPGVAVHMILGFRKTDAEKQERRMNDDNGPPVFHIVMIFALMIVPFFVLFPIACWGGKIRTQCISELTELCRSQSKANPSVTFSLKHDVRSVAEANGRVRLVAAPYFEISVAETPVIAQVVVMAPLPASPILGKVLEGTSVEDNMANAIQVSGTVAVGKKFCPNCGHECLGQKFCSECGHSL